MPNKKKTTVSLLKKNQKTTVFVHVYIYIYIYLFRKNTRLSFHGRSHLSIFPVTPIFPLPLLGHDPPALEEVRQELLHPLLQGLLGPEAVHVPRGREPGRAEGRAGGGPQAGARNPRVTCGRFGTLRRPFFFGGGISEGVEDVVFFFVFFFFFFFFFSGGGGGGNERGRVKALETHGKRIMTQAPTTSLREDPGRIRTKNSSSLKVRPRSKILK